MRILFLADRRVDAGSIQALANYTRVGDKLGHTIAVYGSADPRFTDMHFSTDVATFDYLVLVFESKLHWMSGLQLARILSSVPRSRRVILDADGMYNSAMVLDGYDRNHASKGKRAEWLEYYAQLADRVFQPTLSPREPGVESVLFYGYDPWATKADGASGEKVFDILHMAHNWWRWRELSGRLLPALEPIRSQVGPIAFVGLWWDGAPGWALNLGLEEAFSVDTAWLRRLAIEVRPPVPFSDVIPTMSTARVNVMTQRPLFRHLGFVTSKYFEIFTADTIPLVMLDADHAASIYGPRGRALALGDCLGETLLDVLAQPEKYREIVKEVRRHLTEHHSYQRRLLELVRVLEG